MYDQHARRVSTNYVAMTGDTLETADGQTFGPGAVLTQVKLIADVRTGGGSDSLFPGDERIVGQQPLKIEWLINGVPVEGPVKITRATMHDDD